MPKSRRPHHASRSSRCPLRSRSMRSRRTPPARASPKPRRGTVLLDGCSRCIDACPCSGRWLSRPSHAAIHLRCRCQRPRAAAFHLCRHQLQRTRLRRWVSNPRNPSLAVAPAGRRSIPATPHRTASCRGWANPPKPSVALRFHHRRHQLQVIDIRRQAFTLRSPRPAAAPIRLHRRKTLLSRPATFTPRRMASCPEWAQPKRRDAEPYLQGRPQLRAAGTRPLASTPRSPKPGAAPIRRLCRHQLQRPGGRRSAPRPRASTLSRTPALLLCSEPEPQPARIHHRRQRFLRPPLV